MTLDLSPASLAVLDELERWVNDGSPSGFGVDRQLSPGANPFGPATWFSPLRIAHPGGLEVERLRASRFASLQVPVDFCIHPDMAAKWEALGCVCSAAADVRLVPTSSGRTARLLSSNGLQYLKFDFDGTLGRVNRAITRPKALASVEITDELAALIEHSSRARMAILPEHAVDLVRPLGSDAPFSGLLHRSGAPVGSNAAAIDRLVPLFSFWSADRRTGQRGVVLRNHFRDDINAYVEALRRCCLDVIDFYFAALIERGLQLEFNAQNVLIGLDKDGTYAASCLRDFSSTEKDYPLRHLTGLPMRFGSAPYKVLETTGEHYLIRHSFAFDFKLSRYIVDPASTEAEAVRHGMRDGIIRELRGRVQEWLGAAPLQLFPEDGTWYRHPKIQLTGERPYERCSDPLLR